MVTSAHNKQIAPSEIALVSIFVVNNSPPSYRATNHIQHAALHALHLEVIHDEISGTPMVSQTRNDPFCGFDYLHIK